MSNMPRPTMPPTPDPAADMDIGLQTAEKHRDVETNPSSTSTAPQNHVSPTRKRQPGSDPKFSLPPPPSRPRRIIQMKPAVQQKEEQKPSLLQANSKASGSGSGSGAPGSPNATRKGPNPSTAAGKKMARKTAHSVRSHGERVGEPRFADGVRSSSVGADRK